MKRGRGRTGCRSGFFDCTQRRFPQLWSAEEALAWVVRMWRPVRLELGTLGEDAEVGSDASADAARASRDGDEGVAEIHSRVFAGCSCRIRLRRHGILSTQSVAAQTNVLIHRTFRLRIGRRHSWHVPRGATKTRRGITGRSSCWNSLTRRL